MAKRIPVDAETVAAVYAETRSPVKTAERLGLSLTTVERRLVQSGVPRNGQRGMVRKLPSTIRDEYEAGMSMTQIAKKYGASLASVAEALKRAGATSRHRGNTRHVLAAETKKRICDAYMQMGSQEKVAASLGISQAKVSRALLASGIVSGACGPDHASWKGGRIKSGHYFAVWVPKTDALAEMRNSLGYVQEHRLILARSLGRPLNSYETVHHVNGDPKDNRLENLQLRTGRHGKGVVHRCRECGSTNIESVRFTEVQQGE